MKILIGRVLNGYNARRRVPADKQGPTVVHQKPGPLQMIFKLHPDEVSIVENLFPLEITTTKVINILCIINMYSSNSVTG